MHLTKCLKHVQKTEDGGLVLYLTMPRMNKRKNTKPKRKCRICNVVAGAIGRKWRGAVKVYNCQTRVTFSFLLVTQATYLR